MFKKLLKNNELLLQVLLLIVVSYFVTKYFYQTLPNAELYTQNSIFYNVYAYASLKFMVPLVLPLFLYKLRWKDTFNEKLSVIQYFIFLIFSIYAWSVVTLDYNLYFNQAYHIDRIILLILFILSFRFPIAFVYFMILSLLFFNQVSYPDKECSFPVAYVYIKPLFEILILFITFMFLKSFYRKLSILAFFMVVICFHASNYFIPGLGKILISGHYIDWIWVNDLGNIFIAKYSQGWLASYLSLETAERLVGWVSTVTIPMQVFAFLAQTIILFVFFSKRLAFILFISFEFLHLGIFMFTGIFFWKWILLNFAIMYVIKNLNTENIQKIFNYKSMIFAIPFLLFGDGFFHSYNLAWYDTPLNNFNQMYVITENGKKYKVDLNILTPYDRIFYRKTLNCFIDRPLKSRWDTTSQDIMMKLTALSNEADDSLIEKNIATFEESYGINEFNKFKQEEVISFIQVIFRNLNNYKDNKSIWRNFSPLRDVYISFDWEELLNESSKIKQVDIIFSKKFYNHKKNKLMFLEEKKLISIKI